MTDAIPTTDAFRPVVLRVLLYGAVLSVQQLVKVVADSVGLSDKARAQKIPSGQYRYSNRIQWACSGLTMAGLLERPERGTYSITPDGLAVAKRGLTTYSENDMLEWATWRDYQQEIKDRKSREPIQPKINKYESGSDPVEVISTQVESLQAQVETELRRKLQHSSPEFFEKAVVELLWAMGYGGAHGEKQHIGKPGDGGIDGVIRQDALGLSKVYIQAKRYADDNKVHRPEVQQFYGSLASHGADRGVFITISSFSPNAHQAANDYKTIVLVDGVRLTSLMVDYGVGIRRSRTFEVDENFFEEDQF